MTCNECLSMLATASLREMAPDSAVMAHCETCPDCARVTTLVRDKEYEAATFLNALPPDSNPVSVAEIAVRMAHRRRIGRIAVMATGAALVVTIWIVAATTVIPALNRSDLRLASVLHTETIQLSCLSPQQAGDLINPYVRSHGSAYYVPSSGLSAITVRATSGELRKARSLIHEFDNNPGAACVPVFGATPDFARLKAQSQAAAQVSPEGTPAAPKKK